MKTFKVIVAVVLLHGVIIGGIIVGFQGCKSTKPSKSEQTQIPAHEPVAPAQPVEEAMPAPVASKPSQKAVKQPVPEPAVIEPAPQAKKEPAAPVYYQVKKGDTLTKIARKQGTTVHALMVANRLNSDVIRIGQKLKIPPPGKYDKAPRSAVAKTSRKAKTTTARKSSVESSAPEVASEEVTTSSDTPGIHVVKAGESPVVIAKQHNVTVKDLLAVNNISDPRKLKIGQKLQIPGHAQEAPAPVAETAVESVPVEAVTNDYAPVPAPDMTSPSTEMALPESPAVTNGETGMDVSEPAAEAPVNTAPVTP